jgi:chromosome segregation ATPase
VKKTQSAKKKIKYSDESYEELDGLKPEELRQLNRLQEEAGSATDRYEEVLDVQRSMDEEIANCLQAVHQMDQTVETYKEYLNFKYRK